MSVWCEGAVGGACTVARTPESFSCHVTGRRTVASRAVTDFACSCAQDLRQYEIITRGRSAIGKCCVRNCDLRSLSADSRSGLFYLTEQTEQAPALFPNHSRP